MRLNKEIMNALAYEQGFNYNPNERKSGMIVYDSDDQENNNLLLIFTNEGRDFRFETGEDMDVSDAKEAGIYDAFLKVNREFDDHE